MPPQSAVSSVFPSLLVEHCVIGAMESLPRFADCKPPGVISCVNVALGLLRLSRLVESPAVPALSLDVTHWMTMAENKTAAVSLSCTGRDVVLTVAVAA